MEIGALIPEVVFRTWASVCLQQYGRLVSYIANLPEDRWVKRVLDRIPIGFKPDTCWQGGLVV